MGGEGRELEEGRPRVEQALDARAGQQLAARAVAAARFLGAVPFPVKYRIYFGEPMRFTGNPSDEDEVIGEKVEQVKARIATMLADGLAARRSLFW